MISGPIFMDLQKNKGFVTPMSFCLASSLAWEAKKKTANSNRGTLSPCWSFLLLLLGRSRNTRWVICGHERPMVSATMPQYSALQSNVFWCLCCQKKCFFQCSLHVFSILSASGGTRLCVLRASTLGALFLNLNIPIMQRNNFTLDIWQIKGQINHFTWWGNGGWGLKAKKT